MPRHNRPAKRSPHSRDDSLGVSAWVQSESGPDGDWIVRTVPGARASKVYRCPGCDHEIQLGVPHVVVWPADETGTVVDRRHWHRPCWEARARRRPR